MALYKCVIIIIIIQQGAECELCVVVDPGLVCTDVPCYQTHS